MIELNVNIRFNADCNTLTVSIKSTICYLLDANEASFVFEKTLSLQNY